MRSMLIVAVLTAVLSDAAVAQRSRVSIAFNGNVRQAITTTNAVGAALAAEASARAWVDSVDVLVDVMAKDDPTIIRVQPGEKRPAYAVSVLAEPAIVDDHPTGMVAYALTFFSCNGFGVCKYARTDLGLSRTAQQGARGLLTLIDGTIQSLRGIN
jgi:hypothetical protein